MLILDDATSNIYYAQLVEAESRRTVVAALRGSHATTGLVLVVVRRSSGSFLCHAQVPRPCGSWPSDAGSFCGTYATRSSENRSRLHPAGELRPARTSAWHSLQ